MPGRRSSRVRLHSPVPRAIVPAVVGFVVLALSTATADVTGVTHDAQGGHGQCIIVEMRLNSDSGSVDALNGELAYDSNILSNPRVAMGWGAMGYTAAGHAVHPGDTATSGAFRFLLYNRSGEGTLSLRRPVVLIVFDVIGTAEVDMQTSSRVEFPEAAAARIVSESAPDVVSVGHSGETVIFQPFTVYLTTAAKGWQQYE